MTTPLLLQSLATRAISSQTRVDVGAVVGGVLGGVAFNFIIYYLIYRFCLRGHEQPLYQDVEYEALYDAEAGAVEDEREMVLEMERVGASWGKRWSKRTMETRWSSIRTESTRLSSLRFDRFSLKGLPPVPVLLEREGESGR